MFKHDRGGLFTVVTFSFIVTEMVLIGAFSYSMGASNAERNLRAEVSSRQFSETSDERISRNCSEVRGPELISCVQKEVVATQEHRLSEYNLNAQEGIEDSTFYLLWAALGSLAVSLLALNLVWRNLYLARQTLSSTQDMVKDAREIGEAQVRAYIGILDAQVAIVPHTGADYGDYPQFSFRVKNSGNSPAKSFEVNVQSVYLCSGADGRLYGSSEFLSSHWPMDKMPTKFGVDIDAGESREIEFGSLPSYLRDSERIAFLNKDLRLIITLYTNFVDVFHKIVAGKLFFIADLSHGELGRKTPLLYWPEGASESGERIRTSNDLLRRLEEHGHGYSA